MLAAVSRKQQRLQLPLIKDVGLQVRMQAEGKLPEGTPKKYPNAFKAYSIIAR